MRIDKIDRESLARERRLALSREPFLRRRDEAVSGGFASRERAARFDETLSRENPPSYLPDDGHDAPQTSSAGRADRPTHRGDGDQWA